jgi:asparagine synthetase B (glutamine-hydrolysing)
MLARDHLGHVPLYFTADRGRLAVASALPALAALP